VDGSSTTTSDFTTNDEITTEATYIQLPAEEFRAMLKQREKQ
jgi:hypothetical protein